VFFLFVGSFWELFLLILELLGPHLGSQKVDAIFDRKTGTQVIAGNPETGGPEPLRTTIDTPLG
jgi:hypothetical protein